VAWIAMAFDFGRRRIGLASGDSLTRAARPAGVVQCAASGIDWPAIEKQVRAVQPSRLVVGLPCNADGTPGELAGAAQSFARELTQRFKLPVSMVDERWSSLEASGRLKSARQSGALKRRVRKEDIDATAACVILERWFTELSNA
jgi:putative Holliday junction resolvase